PQSVGARDARLRASSEGAPPNPIPTESASVTVTPPAAGTFLSLPSATNAIVWPSGENAGVSARSVPGIGVGSSAPRRLIQRRSGRCPSTKTWLEPSGDRLMAGSLVLTAALSPSDTYCQLVGSRDAARARTQPQAASAPRTTA